MELFPELMLFYLDQLSSCFSRYSIVFFEGYVWSLLISNGRKCMSRLASACWFVDRHLSSWERFLADHQWSVTELTHCWFRLLSSRLLKLGAHLSELIFVLDTTLISKVQGAMLGVQKWSAHPGDNEAEKKIIGHHWAILGLAVKLKNRYFCFGLFSRLISGQLKPAQWRVDSQGQCRVACFWDAIHPLLWQTVSMTQQGLLLVCDAYFSKAGFLNPIVFHNQHSRHRIKVITRMRWDAVCFELLPPSRKKGSRGPTPQNPESVKIGGLLKTEPRHTWKTLLYGQAVSVEGVEVIRNIRGVDKVVKLVVVDHQTSHPLILLSLDIHLTPAEIIEFYGARFSIELLIRECKSEMGMGQYQCYTTLAFSRFVQLCLMITSLWKLFFLESNPESSEVSFHDMKTEIRLRSIRFAFSHSPWSSGDFNSFEPLIQNILKMAS